MEKPAVSGQMISELCGNNLELIASLHHGLSETPLRRLYQVLNLDEAVAFAAMSWKLRNKNRNFFNLLTREDIYEIFKRVNDLAFPWLYGRRDISVDLDQEYRQLNPYGKNLSYRLHQVAGTGINLLLGVLNDPVRIYYFGRNGKINHVDASKLNRHLNRLQSHPSESQKIKIYSAESARILSSYPPALMDIQTPRKTYEQLPLLHL